MSCDSRACAQEENILKEINAVDSEHNKNVHEDGRREFQLLRSTTRRDQPLRQYGSGNLFTLSRRARTRELLRITRPRHFESHGDLPGEPSDGEGGEGGSEGTVMTTTKDKVDDFFGVEDDSGSGLFNEASLLPSAPWALK